MQNLIIIKPVALEAKTISGVMGIISEFGLQISAMKMTLLDIHNLKCKEETGAAREELLEAKKVPCLLIAVSGEKALECANAVSKEYKGKVHTSLNGEIAKYEIQRLFGENEVFTYDKVGEEVFWGKESREWKKFSKKSVEEIEKELSGSEIVSKK